MRPWKEEASGSMETGSNSARRTEPALDLISSVKRLHGLGSQELSKLIRESDNIILRHITENGSLIQIDVEKLARYLSLHLIAVSLAWKRDKALFEYLLSGIRLLHSLYDLASHSKIEQILLDDVKVSEQLIDLAFYAMIALGCYRQDNEILNDMPLLHSTIVASSLYLLKVCISSQWQELAQVFLAYYKVDMFMDAAFAAVRLDIKILQTKLSDEYVDSYPYSIPSTGEMLNYLCQQCEASVQFLQSLCQQKLFRERLVKNKELCGKGGVLLLAQSILSLKIPSLFQDSSSVGAAVSRLKSRVLSILLHLCEAESVSYLDEVAGTPGSLDLAKSIALEVLELLKKMFGGDSKQSSACSDKIYPRGQLQLNAMRLADIFSDDSNFRSYITKHLTEILTAIFLLPHGEFLSSWCSSALPIWEEDAVLEYDPFAAAGWALNPFSSMAPVNPLNSESTVVPGNLPRASYAHQRTALLVKVIANLHCFVPDICKEEKDLFLNKFLECLQKGSPRLSDGYSSISTTEKAAIVRRNQSSLLSHAESLIPSFLNEEDVQLLRVFISQLETRITLVEVENHQVRGSKFEGSVSWDKFSKLNISEHHQEAQSTEGCSSPLLREVARADNRNGNTIDHMSENSAFLEAGLLNFKSNSMKQSTDAGRNDKCNSSRSAARGLREVENDTQNGETSGSNSSSTHEKNPVDQDNIEHVKEGGVVEVHEEDKVEAIQHEEKQQRKRKRTLMNDIQIELVEKALQDKPDMQRNISLLKVWAEKLSAHGPEVTTSQLKNWLNNRKARLARAAKDGRVLYEGDNADKQGGHLIVPPYDSPTSPIGDIGTGSTARRNHESGAEDTTIRACPNENSVPNEITASVLVQCEPGQYVVLVNEKVEEIGKGKVFQVHGKWYGWNLDESETCVVDITDLKVERFAKIPYPSPVTGTSFDQAEEFLGLMRVLWDSNKLLVFPPR